MRKGHRKVKARVLVEFINSMEAEPTILAVAPTSGEATRIEQAIREALIRFRDQR